MVGFDLGVEVQHCNSRVGLQTGSPPLRKSDRLECRIWINLLPPVADGSASRFVRCSS